MGWYRFVGAAGAKMPTKRVSVFKCGTKFPGWLDGAHPTVKGGEVYGRSALVITLKVAITQPKFL